MTLEVKTNNTTLLAVAFWFWQAWNLSQQFEINTIDFNDRTYWQIRYALIDSDGLMSLDDWCSRAILWIDSLITIADERFIFKKWLIECKLLPMIWNFSVHGTAVHGFVLQSYLHKQFTRIVHILVSHPHHFVTVNNNKSNDSNNLDNKITRHNFLTDLIFYGGEELEKNYAIAKIFSDFLPAHNLLHFTPIYGNSGVGESFHSSFWQYNK